MDNAAQQTANKIVDTIVSGDSNKVEDAFGILSNKLYTDVYSSEPSTQGRAKFIADVFADVNAQFTHGKEVPSTLAMAWATQQLGHELPREGFSKGDLEHVQASSDPNVTVLDKFMAGQILGNFSDLQRQAMVYAVNRSITADHCKDDKKIDPTYNHFVRTCSETVDPADLARKQGVIRQILPSDLERGLHTFDDLK